MKQWLTVKEAALVAGRHQSRVYAWIEQGKLKSRTAADGTIEVVATDVQRVESVTKRGRPLGSLNRR